GLTLQWICLRKFAFAVAGHVDNDQAMVGQTFQGLFRLAPVGPKSVHEKQVTTSAVDIEVDLVAVMREAGHIKPTTTRRKAPAF
ncbi:MAG: hypothetical protein HOC72_14085, partial [Rhodospirillaceae bacterium]|nr:hypothetical protein [Rhodospirillaceae bacterium]